MLMTVSFDTNIYLEYFVQVSNENTNGRGILIKPMLNFFSRKCSYLSALKCPFYGSNTLAFRLNVHCLHRTIIIRRGSLHDIKMIHSIDNNVP